MLKFAIPAVLAVAAMPAFAKAGGWHDGWHHSRSGFSISIGIGGGGCYDGGYYRAAYSDYCAPRYYAPPVVYRPVYVAPPPVVYYPQPAPVYYYPPPSYSSGGYISGSYYYGR